MHTDLRTIFENLSLSLDQTTNELKKVIDIQDKTATKIQTLRTTIEGIKKSSTLAHEKRFAAELLLQYAFNLDTAVKRAIELNQAPNKPLPPTPQPLVRIPASEDLFPVQTDLFSDEETQRIDTELSKRLEKQRKIEQPQIQQPTSQPLPSQPQVGTNWLAQAQMASDHAQTIKENIKRYLNSSSGPKTQDAAKRAMKQVEKARENYKLAQQSPQNALYYAQIALAAAQEARKLARAADTLAKDYKEKLEQEQGKATILADLQNKLENLKQRKTRLNNLIKANKKIIPTLNEENPSEKTRKTILTVGIKVTQEQLTETQKEIRKVEKELSEEQSK
jgi:hypothetical protein